MKNRLQKIYMLFLVLIFGSCSNYSSSDLADSKLIVDKLLQMEFTRGKLVHLYVDDLKVTNGIVPLATNSSGQFLHPETGRIIGRGSGRGSIRVLKTKEAFMVFVETVDNGHSGEYGYAYSSTPNTIDMNHYALGDFWAVTSQINEYWWKIKYDLG